MAKRKKMGRKQSRKTFTKHAKKVHGRNVWTGPMRGGIRL